MSNLAVSSWVLPCSSEFITEQVKKYRATLAPILRLPEDVVWRSFSFLSPEDLAIASSVHREWKSLAGSPDLWDSFNLEKIFFSFKIFNGKDWKAHFDLKSQEIDVEEEPKLDKRQVISSLKPVIGRSCMIRNGEGGTLLTMPRGLTLRKLEQLASQPKQSLPTPLCVRNSGNDIKNIFWDRRVTKTYRMFISNNFLSDHFFKINPSISSDFRKSIIKTYSPTETSSTFPYESSGSGLEETRLSADELLPLPTLIQASTLPIVSYIASKISLYSFSRRSSGLQSICCSNLTRSLFYQDQNGQLLEECVMVGSFDPSDGLIFGRLPIHAFAWTAISPGRVYIKYF